MSDVQELSKQIVLSDEVSLYNGDCVDVLRQIESNSIDTIITDPPYGLKFMGKRWDYDIPKMGIWEECLRILKPGGTALIFAGSRTQHRMACNVEDAGFILKDCIEFFVDYDWVDFYNSLDREQKQIFSNLTSDNRLFWVYGSGFPKAADISKQLDKGNRKKIRATGSLHKNRNMNDDDNWNKIGDDNALMDDNNPVSEEAKIWSGWKSHGLKPSYEPILVAQKPNNGTYANNALKWGVSGLNIDGGRIPLQEHGEDKRLGGKGDWSTANAAKNVYEGGYAGVRVGSSEQGRFPANVILDEEAGKMLDRQSGSLGNNFRKSKGSGLGVGMFGVSGGETQGQNDSGGASRFFYCAKASKAERNAGCEKMLEQETKRYGNYKRTPEHAPKIDVKNTNHHPTVKPIKLMEYLCTLTKTPTGGVVLDPFMGSGTTGIACKKTDRKFIGIERELEYFNIALARIENANIDFQKELKFN